MTQHTSKSAWRSWFLAVVILGGSFLLAASPALGRVAQAELLSVIKNGISGSVTFKLAGNGHDVGKTTVGVVGKGTISGKLSLDATFAARVVGAIKGVPLTGIAKGGSYVTQYDIDEHNNHSGIVVISFKATGVGSLCLSFTAVYGKFSSAADYVPSNGRFQSLSGSEKMSSIHVSGKYSQGEVTGSAIEKILGGGSIGSLGTGTVTPLTRACLAVAKLA